MTTIMVLWIAMSLCQEHKSGFLARHYEHGWKQCYAIEAKAKLLEPRFIDEALKALEPVK